MPLTPFHLGFGVAAKAIMPRRFSFTIFSLTQIVMDLEPTANILLGRHPIHGVVHTYLGATFVAAAALLIGPPVVYRLKREWNRRMDPSLRARLTVDEEVTFRAAIFGAFIGTYSHVLLDSLVHADVQPFYPFSPANPMLGLAARLLGIGQ